MKALIGKILVYLFGIGFIVIGFLFYLDYSGSNIANPEKTKGRIIKILKTDKINTIVGTYDSPTFRPVILFNTKSGQEISFIELHAKGDKSDYQINMEVGVIYNKEKPEQAKMIHLNPLWGEHLILIGLGLIIIFIRILV